MSTIHPLSGQDILAMQHVKRWHMIRTKRVQTLAEHVATVAMFSSKIADLWEDETDCPPIDRSELLQHALTHDAHEVEFGDPPSPAVRVAPEAHAAAQDSFWSRRPPQRPLERRVVEQIVVIADKLEALLFYLLEGEDQRIENGCEESLRKALADAPPAVGVWATLLVVSVKGGHWTPQPAGVPLPPPTP